MKKRILSAILIMAYSAVTFCTAFAAEPYEDTEDAYKNTIALMIDSNVCVVNGETKSVGDVNPTIVQDRTLVPVRFLAESLGGSAQWDDSTKTATLQLDETQIDVPIGESHIVVDGEKTQLDVGGTLINDRTMLPLRGICEAMGKDVSYDDGMILIGDKDFNDRTADEDSDITKQLLRYQLTKGKVLKAEPVTKMGIEELAEKSECVIVDSAMLPYESKKDVCYLSRGRMNIVNMSGKMKDPETFVLDFDVYNQRCSYGIAEVYDADGNLIDTKTIYPYGGAMTTSLSTWFENAKTDVPESFKAIYEYASGNSNYVDYKTQAKVTHIHIEAPKNGYMLFTANSAHSALVEKKNIIHAVSKVISTVYSVAGAYGGVVGSDVDMLFEEALSSELEKFFVENTEVYMNVDDIVMDAIKNNEITAFGYKKCLEKIVQEIYNGLADSELNIYSLSQSAITALANNKGYKMSLDLKEQLPLVGEAFGLMDAMANVFNLLYFVMDFDESYYAPNLVFIFRDTPTIESSNIMAHNKKVYTSGKELPGLASIKELMSRTIGYDYVIYNNKIYHSWLSDSKGNWDSKLYSCNLDGSDDKLIFEDDSSGACRFIVSGDRIYFTSIKKYLDTKTGICSDLSEMLSRNEIIFYAKGSNIYSYKKSGDSYDISQINVDTGVREVIATRGNRIDKCFETAEGDVYYLEIEWLEGAWLYQVKDGKTELVYSFNKEFESVEAIIDSVIYYTGDTGNCVYLEYYDLKNQTGGRISEREYFAGGASFYN